MNTKKGFKLLYFFILVTVFVLLAFFISAATYDTCIRTAVNKYNVNNRYAFSQTIQTEENCEDIGFNVNIGNDYTITTTTLPGISRDWSGERFDGDGVRTNGDNVYAVFPPTCLNENLFSILSNAANYCLWPETGTSYNIYKISSGYPSGKSYTPRTACTAQWCGDWKLNIRPISNEGVNLYDSTRLVPNEYLSLPNENRRYVFNTWGYVNRTLIDLAYGISVNRIAIFEIYYYNTSTRNLEQIYSKTFTVPGTHSNNDLPSIEQGWYLFKILYISWRDNERVLDINFYPSGSNSRPLLREYFQIINSYGPLSFYDGDVDKYSCENDPYFVGMRYWKDGQPIGKSCCGDDANDYGFVSTDGKICTIDGWSDVTDLCYIDGEYKQGTHFIASLQYNNTANDGSDGCCGDDLPGCYSRIGFYYPPACNYNTQISCESNDYCKWIDNICTIKTPEEYCNQFSVNDCPTNICEYRVGDYGYVSPDKKYLCYNTSNHINSNGGGFKWVSSNDNIFNASRIFLLNNKEADFISNAVNWSYCNASNIDLSAIPVKEYSSFQSKYNFNNALQCYEFMNLLGYNFNGACGPSNTENCCVNRLVYLTDPSTLESCTCYTGNGELTNVCSSSYASLFPFCDVQQGFSVNNEYIEKSLCMFDFINCIDQDYYDPTKTCSQQIPPGTVCNNQQVCVNGVIINAKNTPADGFCCYSKNDEESCIDKNNIDCDSVNGIIFDINSQECMAGYSYFRTDNNQYCCLGPVRQKTYDIMSLFSRYNNDSYICYNENNNSLFGHCCYDDKCMYPEILLGTVSLNQYNGRLFYSGNALHTVSSYDKYAPERGSVIDYVFKYRTAGSTPTIVAIENNISLSSFKYLEFSIVYSNKNLIGNVAINNVNYGPLLNYIIGSDESMRWHRVKIPIHNMNKNEHINSLTITKTGSGDLTILIDNIILLPEHTSSDNYYCSAGFGKWIPDLDTNLTKYPFGHEFYTGNDAWKNKGVYEYACNSVGGYYWTGHQCCGDDTSKDNYGEFYNDTGAGCFNGTIVFDKKTVSYSYNIQETVKNQFESFIYKDLIYNDSYFVACQVNTTNKYSDMKISYDGKLSTYPGTNQLSNLIVNNIANSCTKIGDYYCFNNAWRQNINGVGLLGLDYNNSLSLKTVPPATNLIKNSNFGGDCPENICQQSIST
ncbi:MAG: hypothetical protein KatS3mg002_0584 [Candidatus Woesearchaeota archaeon]|nr:MAG: hypothetical protein KatS3mg002_0584 [Candidatus Woesearchaeota archaeon]